MKNWPDAKRFIFEGIVMALALIIFALTCDWLFNLSIATGINHGELHPYKFGFLQWTALITGIAQLLRYANAWRYWG